MVVKTAHQTAGFAWVILLLLFLQIGSPFRALAQPAEAYGLVEAVNAYRESVGLPRLSTSGGLMVAAQRHAEWMAANYTYSHTGEGGSRPQDRAEAAGFAGNVSENVAGSTTATPAEAVFFWDQSYIHRITMRAPLATHIGGGFAANSDQRLFVLLIGTAPGQAPLPTTQPIAGGTPAIGYTPPPGLMWTTDGQTHHGSDYIPVAPAGDQESTGQAAPTLVAYVMPFDQIRLAEPRANGSVVHVVEMGQTAWAIAARYGVDWHAMLVLNHLADDAVLHPGDELIIRLGEGEAPPPAPTAPSTYRVQAGESLWAIAARYNLTVDELRVWNDLSAEDVIQPGDTLVVYPPAPVPTATVTAAESPSAAPTVSPSATLTETPLSPATMLATTITSIPLGAVHARFTPTPLRETTLGRASPEKDGAIRVLVVLGALVLIVTMLAGAIILWLAWKSRPTPLSGNYARSRHTRE